MNWIKKTIDKIAIKKIRSDHLRLLPWQSTAVVKRLSIRSTNSRWDNYSSPETSLTDHPKTLGYPKTSHATSRSRKPSLKSRQIGWRQRCGRSHPWRAWNWGRPTPSQTQPGVWTRSICEKKHRQSKKLRCMIRQSRKSCKTSRSGWRANRSRWSGGAPRRRAAGSWWMPTISSSWSGRLSRRARARQKKSIRSRTLHLSPKKWRWRGRKWRMWKAWHRLSKPWTKRWTGWRTERRCI